ncbi:MAG: AAA family ATPase [Lachnospiraceae bacterium]|nr:AAA family ATPase [Lachnospiraceae bacterium]
MLKRKLYERLCSWKKESQGKTVVLLEGARQVGKSYMAKRFAESEYKTYLVVDFSNIASEVLMLFEDDLDDLDYLFHMLSIYYDVKLYPRETLIIFDEIQLYPKIRQNVKQLVADGRFDYLETGSWISLRRNVQNITIPKEERCITVYPLDFEEFLWAMGDESSYPVVERCYKRQKPVTSKMHHDMMKMFRQYMLVGGMPQAVIAYAATKDFEQTENEKRKILTLYRNDVGEYAKGWERKVLAVFDGIPRQLSKREKKYTLASLQKEARLREYRTAFQWLDDARMIEICFNNRDPEKGMGKNKDRVAMKCYMPDTGLLVSHAFNEEKMKEDKVLKNIMFNHLEVHEGMLLENAVAQLLRTKGHKLLFYYHSDNENAKNRMKIDFLIRQRRKLCPITVKAGHPARHISLDKFEIKYRDKLGKKYVICTKNLEVKENLVYLPVYMTSCL